MVAHSRTQMFPDKIKIAFLAQLGERQTEDLKVVGSSPTGGIFKISNSNIS